MLGYPEEDFGKENIITIKYQHIRPFMNVYAQ